MPAYKDSKTGTWFVKFYITTVYDEMNQPCAHWARSWHSYYGVRRNPGIFFYVFLHFKK